MDAYLEQYLYVLKKNYANFEGRARRQEFWTFTLINLAIYVILAVLSGVVGLFALVALAFNLAVLVPSIAVGVRRMHDINRSGWWMLIVLVPLIGLFFLYLAAQPSDPADNNFGPVAKSVAA